MWKVRQTENMTSIFSGTASTSFPHVTQAASDLPQTAVTLGSRVSWDDTLQRELWWSMKYANRDYSLKSCKNISYMLQGVFLCTRWLSLIMVKQKLHPNLSKIFFTQNVQLLLLMVWFGSSLQEAVSQQSPKRLIFECLMKV